ncbi:hypothetical protein FPQ18DRAFT_306844 [Pyronema domesticum]|nr:hypothetical protein FPQ18DRAFT_306844 [Pyronema domesticum]
MSTTSITNADDGSDGALTASGPDRLTEVLSHQQAVDSAVASCIIDVTVKWDMRNQSQLIRVLEGWVIRLQQMRSTLTGFNLTEERRRIQHPGLPMHEMLGRPAFVVFDTVGSVEAIAQAHALMEAWGLRKLEAIYQLPTTTGGTPRNNSFGVLFQARFSGGIVADRGLINRADFQTNFDCRRYLTSNITVLACIPEILSIRPQTPIVELRSALTATVPPLAQH